MENLNDCMAKNQCMQHDIGNLTKHKKNRKTLIELKRKIQNTTAGVMVLLIIRYTSEESTPVPRKNTDTFLYFNKKTEVIK